MSVGRIRFLLILMCVSVALWIVFARVFVPPLIESVYRGESLRLLNGLIKGQSEFPVSHYLHKWDVITGDVVVGSIAFWVLSIVISSPVFVTKFVGEAT